MQCDRVAGTCTTRVAKIPGSQPIPTVGCLNIDNTTILHTADCVPQTPSVVCVQIAERWRGSLDSHAVVTVHTTGYYYCTASLQQHQVGHG